MHGDVHGDYYHGDRFSNGNDFSLNNIENKTESLGGK